MCIAVLKPKDVPMITKKQMKICWENNPDGAGFAFNDNEKVHAFKGFMTFDDFYKKISEVQQHIDLDKCDVLLHFRIATHGGVNPECTHPFPVTNNIDEMKYLKYTCNAVFAHNGILAGYGSKATGFSDTMEYNAKVISSIRHLKEQPKLIDALAHENYSRFVLLFKDTYILGGDWIEKDGIAYSNSSYKKKTYVSPVVSSMYDGYSRYNYCSDKTSNFVDSNTTGKCDYCGAKGELYTDNTVWICKECVDYENKYLKYGI